MSTLVSDLLGKFNISFVVNLFSNKLILRYKTVSGCKLTLKDGIFDANIILHLYYGKGGVIVFDKPITRISQVAFLENNDLEEIAIPDGVTIIEDRAFCLCKNLNQVSLSKNLTTLEYSAFAGCKKLVEITIPDSVTEVGSSCFYECENLIRVTIGCGVTSIEDHAFFCCRKLKRVNIPESVTKIGKYAFNGCSLKRITIPDNVCTISEGAFRYCRKLKEVRLGKNITDIYIWAFHACEKLEEFYCNAEIPPYVDSIAFTTNDYDSGKIVPISTNILYVPPKTVNAYKQADRWSAFAKYIKPNPYL